MTTRTRVFWIAVAMTAAACTVKETPIPPLSGPSELGLRINVQAVPDSILQDGFSQTVINIEATGADGRPVRGLPLRVEIVFGGSIQDFGTLSAKTVVTGDDGRVRVIYTAPPRFADQTDPIVVVNVQVTPIGNDFGGSFRRVVDIRLVQPGVIRPPNSPPVARFTFQPAAPTTLTNVTFDASTSTDPDLGGPCGPLCTYNWDFGDGTTGTGIFATHQYRTVGTVQVRLTVTDAGGASGTAAQSLTVGAGTPPTASFTFSPTNPAIDQTVFFTAEASRAAPGRSIVSYEWNFGIGRTASGVTASRSFSAAGTYTVTLTVTDDAGQQATASQTVPVGAQGTGPTASLTVSPTSGGNTSTNFFFDASGSRPGPSPIIEYRFTWGDTTPDTVGASPTATHRYLLPGTYTARVTVRDSANRTASATVSVTVN